MNRVQCLRTKDMINDYLDGTLAHDDQKELFAHIELCESCRDYFEDMKAIADCMAEDLLEDLPEEFEQQLHAKLQAVSAERALNSTEHNISEFRAAKQKKTSGLQNGSFRRFMPTLSAAAVVVLAFGVTMSGMGGFDQSKIPKFGNAGALPVAYDLAAPSPAEPEANMTVGSAPPAPSAAPESAKMMTTMAPTTTGGAGATDQGVSRMAKAAPDNQAEFTDVTKGKQAQVGHKIIKSGSLTLESTELDKAIKKLQDMTEKNGGFIENANVGNAPPVYEPSGVLKSGTENLRSAYYHVRIPSEKFDAVMNEMAGIGKEINRSVSSQDITTQYVDNESQLKNLRVREESLRTLMGKTGNIKDLLEVDRELTDVRSQIDSLMSQKKVWDGQVSLSSIDVNLNEVKSYTGEINKSPEGAGGMIKKALVDSANALIAVVAKTFYILVVLLPYVILFAGVYVGMNKWLKRKDTIPLSSKSKDNIKLEEEHKNEKDTQ